MSNITACDTKKPVTETSSRRVSVIIPTFNRARDVVRAARSVIAQTCSAQEILIVDDGSTDDTEAVISGLPAPVRYIRKPNGGVSSARNVGIRVAVGEFVAFLDSDDYWDPEWIDVATRLLDQTPDLCAVTAAVQWEYPDGKVGRITDLSNVAVDGRLSLPVMLQRSIGANLLVRRNALVRVGEFDESLTTGEDIDMVLRLIAEGGIGWVGLRMIHMTHSPQSLSSRIDTGNRLRVFSKFEQQYPELAARYAGDFRSVRAATALSYACDLTVARRFPQALERAKESFGYRPSIRAAVQTCKIIVLMAVSAIRKP